MTESDPDNKRQSNFDYVDRVKLAVSNISHAADSLVDEPDTKRKVRQLQRLRKKMKTQHANGNGSALVLAVSARDIVLGNKREELRRNQTTYLGVIGVQIVPGGEIILNPPEPEQETSPSAA